MGFFPPTFSLTCSAEGVLGRNAANCAALQPVAQLQELGSHHSCHARDVSSAWHPRKCRGVFRESEIRSSSVSCSFFYWVQVWEIESENSAGQRLGAAASRVTAGLGARLPSPVPSPGLSQNNKNNQNPLTGDYWGARQAFCCCLNDTERGLPWVVSGSRQPQGVLAAAALGPAAPAGSVLRQLKITPLCS